MRSPRTLTRRLARLALLALVAGLASTSALGCGPGGRTRLGTEQTDTTIEAPTASVARYDTRAPEEGASVVGGLHADAITRGVSSAASEANVSLTADPRLGTLSDWILDRLGPAGEPPDTQIVDFLGRHLGLVEPSPHILVLGLPNEASIEASVARSTSSYLSRHPYTHWGAAMRARNGLWVIVVTLSFRHASLEPVPRRVEVGAPLTIRGELAEGWDHPISVIERPDGEIERAPRGDARAFSFDVSTAERGVHRVELLGRGPLGEAVVMNFPVYVGEDPPRAMELQPEPATSGSSTASAEEVEAELLRLTNEARRARGLAPLRRDPRLDAIARAHSTDMLEHGFVAHTSPTTGSPTDRVTRAGLRSGLVLENVGRDHSALELHRGLEGSPGHRANLVNPDVNTIGLGVVVDDRDGRRAFLATEVFLRVTDEIDVASAPTRLLELMNRARVARGARALESEPNLTRAAQEAADAYFADPSLSTQAAVDRGSAGLRSYAVLFRRVGGVMAVVSALDDAGQLEPALDAEVDYVGVGVAQGTREDAPPNSIAVVVMLGWARN